MPVPGPEIPPLPDDDPSREPRRDPFPDPPPLEEPPPLPMEPPRLGRAAPGVVSCGANRP